MPGVRLALRPEFDVTQERPAGCPPDGRPGGHRASSSARSWTGTCGRRARSSCRATRSTGTCSSAAPPGRASRRPCGPCSRRRPGSGIPWLVVEPAKAEYRLMAARLPGAEVIRIRPGEPDAIAAGLNPLEPAVDRDRRQVPSADARGPGPSAVHRVLPVRGAVPAGAQRRPRPGLRGRGLGPRARRAGRRRARRRLPDPDRPAARGRTGRHRDRLLPAGHRRRARLHQGPAGQPQARHDRPLPRGRAPDRFRRAAGQERGARDRGRRRRRGQGVSDGRGADPAGRAPAARPPSRGARRPGGGRPSASDGGRGGAPAAAPGRSPPTGRAGAARPGTRSRCSRACWRRSARTARG